MPVASRTRKQKSLNIIETEAPVKPAVKAARKSPSPVRKAVAKEYPPHEHFGSPTNVCRVCGEKYSYVAKPYAHAPK